MMKKMLLLFLVLGMASIANAGIVVVAPDTVSGSIQTDPIGDVVPQQAFFIGVSGSTISNETLVYTGGLAAVEDYTGVDPDLTAGIDMWIADYAASNAGFDGAASNKILFALLYDDAVPPTDPVGQLITFDAATAAAAVEVYLIDPDLATGVFSAVRIVPEPMTFALLGLGGLFLRRRK